MEFLRAETEQPKYVAFAPGLVIAEPDDVLLLWDGSNAGEFLKARRGVVSSTLARLDPKAVDRAFLFYACKALEPQIKDQTVGMGIPHVSGDELKSCSLPCPSIPEQQAIAAFLDRETGRLDRLVGWKRELIERLKEKRIALISRTVTRGLPPAAARAAGLPDLSAEASAKEENPTLKPSGLPWLGDVPEHWEVKPVKYVARIGNGSTPNRDNAAYWEEGDYPWLNSSSVNRETITDSEDFVTALALQECHLPKINPPAVLIGITGQGRTRGMASTLLFEATINQHVAYVKPSPKKADVGFLRRVFDMAYEFLRSESDGGGSTKGAITCEQIGTMVIPLAPLPEQAAIAAYLDRETAKLDALVAKVEAAIERLQEYRTALITAAVTGKIDVRGAAPTTD
jgi:type I restriction enzyme S subunit